MDGGGEVMGEKYHSLDCAVLPFFLFLLFIYFFFYSLSGNPPSRRVRRYK
jgi:hypothetical protein